MGKLSRNKGAAFEREVAAMLRRIGLDARRNVQESQLGNDGDVLVTDFPLTVQCKVGVRPPVFDALDEAEAVAAPLGHLPVAIIRRNGNKGAGRGRDCAVLRTRDFLLLVRLLRAAGVDVGAALTVEALLHD